MRPPYRWRRWGTGRVCKLSKLGFRPTAWLQGPHCSHRAALCHQAAGASLSGGNALRREECFSKTSRACCPLCVFLSHRLSLCSFLTYLVSFPVLTTQHYPLSYRFCCLAHCHSCFNVLNFYSKELTLLVHSSLSSLRYNWQNLKLKYRMWWFDIFNLCEGIPPIELYIHTPITHLSTFLRAAGRTLKSSSLSKLWLWDSVINYSHHVKH